MQETLFQRRFAGPENATSSEPAGTPRRSP